MLRSRQTTEEEKLRHTVTLTLIIAALKGATATNIQDLVHGAELELKAPWAECVNSRHHNHPVPWWTKELKRKKKLAHRT